jgi:hypothetical protein
MVSPLRIVGSIVDDFCTILRLVHDVITSRPRMAVTAILVDSFIEGGTVMAD